MHIVVGPHARLRPINDIRFSCITAPPKALQATRQETKPTDFTTTQLMPEHPVRKAARSTPSLKTLVRTHAHRLRQNCSRSNALKASFHNDSADLVSRRRMIKNISNSHTRICCASRVKICQSIICHRKVRVETPATMPHHLKRIARRKSAQNTARMVGGKSLNALRICRKINNLTHRAWKPSECFAHQRAEKSNTVHIYPNT